MGVVLVAALRDVDCAHPPELCGTDARTVCDGESDVFLLGAALFTAHDITCDWRSRAGNDAAEVGARAARPQNRPGPFVKGPYMTPSPSGETAAAPGDAVETAAGACALCGLSASRGDAGVLRQLGEPPVVITVCADSDACVTRYAAH
jgi:hypothetical protein